MNIFINTKPAEITLDTEKTLADVMLGLEQWISPTGNRIKGISVNGKETFTDALGETFCTDVKDIEKLDVFICSWRELAAEAMELLYETCILYGKASFDERTNIFGKWEDSSAARFLASDISDLYHLARHTLSGEGLILQDLTMLIEERLREIANPALEISDSETRIRIITERMEELPLDMQTGKDQRAAETVQLFSQMGEKLFRIFFILKSEGLSFETFLIDGLPARSFMEEFNAALRELSAAYEGKDTVLVGDIAEYELAPRLMKFFTALKEVDEKCLE
jgi:hypothetical protein